MSRLVVVTACLFLVAGLLAPCALGKDKETDDPVVQGELGAKLERAVDGAVGSGFWGAVLVAKDGEVLFAKAYGLADFEDRPNTPRTLFELASASKQVTATAVLHLQQKKKLSIEDTLEAFFDDVPEDKKEITVHQLLTHTSGISGNIGVPYGSRLTRKPYIKQMLAKPLASEPGTKFEYCNVGYAMLAAIVEEASRTSFEKYCEKHLFKPAKMKDTGFIQDRDLVKSDRVSSRKPNQGGGPTAADWWYGWGYRGMGGVVSTVYDLLRWDRALRGDDLLNEASKAVLYEPAKAGYACGWRVDTTDRGTRKAHHSGGVAGYATNVVRFLEDDVCIFVLSNSGQKVFEATGAVERVLFQPVTLEASIDVKPYGKNPRRIFELPEQLSWKVKKKKRELVLQLKDKRHVVVEIRAPLTYAGKIVSSLEQAVSAREGDEEEGKPAIEAGLYLQRYNPNAKRLELTKSLRLTIRPEYRSGTVVDKRVLLHLDDHENRCWPLMVKMRADAAKELLEALRKELS